MNFKKIPLEGETENAQLYKARLSSSTREKLRKRLEEEVKQYLDERPTLKICGRKCHANRHYAFFSHESQGYRFSGNIARSKSETPEIMDIMMKKMNEISGFDSPKFNGVLVNYYPNGNYNIGKHADQISDLNVELGVITIGLGQSRTFNIYTKAGKLVKSLDFADGDLIWMAGSDFQRLFKHEIPCENTCMGSRWSLTFRSYKR